VDELRYVGTLEIDGNREVKNIDVSMEDMNVGMAMICVSLLLQETILECTQKIVKRYPDKSKETVAMELYDNMIDIIGTLKETVIELVNVEEGNTDVI
jgi:hypothetical protein